MRTTLTEHHLLIERARALASRFAERVRHQIRTYQAMVRAGANIAAQLDRSQARHNSQTSDMSVLLWSAYAKQGVSLEGVPDGKATPARHSAATLSIGRRQQEGSIMETSVKECLMLARAELGVAKAKLSREISSYPTPISRCDVQFNQLLQERRRITSALAAIDPAG